ncbi:MAG: prepilin-type N-terminal cleavage/methylation domain-containing protein [Candidatus Mariimomonas ferrooxydans]
MGKRGFTLIELLITVAIIGILAVAATTAYIGTVKKAARSEAYSNLESLRLLEEQFFADAGQYTGALGGAGSTIAIRDANLTAIQADLPGFKPGNAANFSYMILADEDFNGIATPTDCFHARATGINNSRVAGDMFDIDCNNDRTF